MMLPSYTVVPDSMLSPSQVQDLFASKSMAGLGDLGGLGGLGVRAAPVRRVVRPQVLARRRAAIQRIKSRLGISGLGCDCSMVDESGACMDPDPCSGSGSTGSGGGTSTTVLNYPGMPTGTVTYTGGGSSTGTPASTPSGTTSTNWTPVITAATQGILDVAKLEAIQPGTVQTSTGATSRQTTGYPITSQTGTVKIGSTVLSGTTVLLIGGGLLLFIFMMSKK